MIGIADVEPTETDLAAGQVTCQACRGPLHLPPVGVGGKVGGKQVGVRCACRYGGPTATSPEEVRPMNAVRTWVLPSSRSGG
jgi:hypothetical protein